MEKDLSPQQSLEIITAMINQTKGNIQKHSFYFILWGWTIALASIGVYVMLKFTHIANPFLIYLITIISAFISMVYGSRQERNAQTTTHLDSIYKWLWISLGISCFIMCLFGYRINYQLNPVIIVMCAAPTLTSGIITRFNPLIYGGIALWVLGMAMFLVANENQFLLAALAVALGYLAPGYALRAKK